MALRSIAYIILLINYKNKVELIEFYGLFNEDKSRNIKKTQTMRLGR